RPRRTAGRGGRARAGARAAPDRAPAARLPDPRRRARRLHPGLAVLRAGAGRGHDRGARVTGALVLANGGAAAMDKLPRLELGALCAWITGAVSQGRRVSALFA